MYCILINRLLVTGAKLVANGVSRKYQLVLKSFSFLNCLFTVCRWCGSDLGFRNRGPDNVQYNYKAAYNRYLMK